MMAGDAVLPPAGSRPIFITEIEQFGGAERSVLALANWLEAQGLPHHILTYFDHCDISRYAAHPLPVIALKPTGGVRAKIASLRSYMRARGPQAPPLLCSGYQPALHATLAGVRGFHTLMHDTPSLFGDEETRSWNGWLRIGVSNAILRYGLGSGGATIVTSEYLKRECSKDFGVDAVIARMGGLAGEAAAEPKAVPPGGPVRMLSVCRIEANKRIDWMLRALAAVNSRAVAPLERPLAELTDWHLDLAGKGSMIAPLQAMAAQLGLADRVTFHGFVSDAELEAMYARANLFLMPAVQGYGIPAIEALHKGMPVLLHRESGVSDILLDTPWATVIEGGEASMIPGLAAALAALLAGSHITAPLPVVPSENEWAERVARLCGWA